MIDDLDWDHVRVFLATMRSTSLRQAAEKLRISHPTARRKLGALEQQLGLRLFDRRSDGLHPTLEAADLQAAAEEVERAMLSLGRVAQAADPDVRGPIRVTLPDIGATDLLMPDLVRFTQRWPDIELELMPSYDLVSLDRREADVAVRFMTGGKLPAEHLTGRKAGTAYRAIYGEKDEWIGWYGGDKDREWIDKTPFPDFPIRGAMSSGWLQRSACAAGLGLTRLPCFFAEPLLKRRTEPEPAFDIWVLVHPDLRRSPRLRLFRDEMVAAVRRLKPRLEGRALRGSDAPSAKAHT
ncbi:MAG: LysR family transcriptional regulator [Myxococcales bacterium]|nr:LysR family transcriptional regulator [Myxococcales bacterium]